MITSLCHPLDSFDLVYRDDWNESCDIHKCRHCGQAMTAGELARVAEAVTALEEAEYDYFNHGRAELEARYGW